MKMQKVCRPLYAQGRSLCSSFVDYLFKCCLILFSSVCLPALPLQFPQPSLLTTPFPPRIISSSSVIAQHSLPSASASHHLTYLHLPLPFHLIINPFNTGPRLSLHVGVSVTNHYKNSSRDSSKTKTIELLDRLASIAFEWCTYTYTSFLGHFIKKMDMEI